MKRYIILFLLFTAVNTFAGPDVITIHYHRPDGDYAYWTLHTWGIHTGKAEDLEQSGRDDFGVIFKIRVQNFGGAADFGLLPKFKDWENRDDPDRIFKTSLGDNLYIVSEDRKVYSERPDVSPRIVKATLESKNRFNIILSKSLTRINFQPKDVIFEDDGGRRHTVISLEPIKNSIGKIKVIKAVLKDEISVTSKIEGKVSVPGYRPGPLVPGKILDDPYFYSKLKLGSIYKPDGTIFRVFAPTALKVYINVYKEPEGGRHKSYKLIKRKHGIWSGKIRGNLLNYYYKIKTVFKDAEYEVMDPYSKCNTATRGRCMITNDKTPISVSPVFNPEDAIIAEIHIREISFNPNSGVKNRGKYIGLTEYPTNIPNNKKIKTVLAHLVELGINVVQIMPFQDFDNDEQNSGHNWGYMPFHFNSPEGMYATKRDDATRIKEVKQMIDAFHKKNIKVVMDVVYNHTAEQNPEARVSFNGLVPNYYYRVKLDGTYSNGSGTGNEFRSESQMAQKYIIDSLKYWVDEYKIDGFRFDLMGLIDLETMKQLTSELKKIKPDILVYGEPWTGGKSLVPNSTTKGKQKNLGFGCFNDNFRNALKAGVSDNSQGYIQAGKNVAGIKRGVIGSITDFCAQPSETINYAECHDNYTLWDKIVVSTKNNSTVTNEDRKNMDKLCAAILMTSQGIPFIQVGQEFLRSKNFEDNPYNKGDSVNSVDWSRKAQNMDVYRYYRELISIRKKHPLFRFRTAEQIKNNIFFLDDDMNYSLPPGCIAFIINKGNTRDRWENCLVIYNPNPTAKELKIPESRWYIAIDKYSYYKGKNMPVVQDKFEVPSRSAMILYNNDPDFKNKTLKKFQTAKKPVKQVFKVNAPDAGSVNLAGSFNDWNMTSLPMKSDGNGKWTLEIELEKGTYDYKFIQDGDWDKLNKDNRQITVKGSNSPAATGQGTLFEVESPDAGKVEVWGSWNDWASSTIMNKSGNKWQVRLKLKPGVYLYKFMKDGDWDALNADNRTITVKPGGSGQSAAVPPPIKRGPSAEIIYENDSARSIVVAGDWNEWAGSVQGRLDLDKDLMKKGADGKWHYTLAGVTEGEHEYKFIVDGNWEEHDNRKINITAKGSSSSKGYSTGTGTLFEVESPNAKSVEIKGSWDNWTGGTPLKKIGNKWQVRLNLKPGKYDYKFLQDGDWDALNKDNRQIEVK